MSDTWPVRCETYGYLPSHRASPSVLTYLPPDCYHICCLLTEAYVHREQGCYLQVEWLRVELTTSWVASPVALTNHCATSDTHYWQQHCGLWLPVYYSFSVRTLPSVEEIGMVVLWSFHVFRFIYFFLWYYTRHRWRNTSPLAVCFCIVHPSVCVFIGDTAMMNKLTIPGGAAAEAFVTFQWQYVSALFVCLCVCRLKHQWWTWSRVELPLNLS